MSEEPPGSLQGVFERAERGDAAAREALFALLYDELHRLAHAHVARARGALTWNTTTLLHEAYLGFARREGMNDHFAWSFAVGDFNGDGRDELATGIPHDDGIAGAEVADAGGVVVSQYFPSTGLYPLNFLRQTPGLDPAEVGDRYGAALAACDFNNDGFDDLAVGIPGERFGALWSVGAVQTHYGSASGLTGTGWEFFSQDTFGIPGDNEDGDEFGSSLACGDFDGDGFEDLAVGAPFEDIGGELRAGMIVIVPGWAGGLVTDFGYGFDQDTTGIDGSSEEWDHFGYSLAAGNFDGDAYVDLAVGVRFEDGVGAVKILFGGASGLDGALDLFWYDEAVGGVREELDEFGTALVAGDFDGDGHDDLAIGAPFETAGTASDGGAQTILYGALFADGFDSGNLDFWSAWVP